MGRARTVSNKCFAAAVPRVYTTAIARPIAARGECRERDGGARSSGRLTRGGGGRD